MRNVRQASWNLALLTLNCTFEITLHLYCSKIETSDITSLWTADISPCSSPPSDVFQGGTSATQWQKFHSDDINQCLHNKSGSHGLPNANLLVNFGKVLCLSANELQENSNASSSEDCIPQIYYWLFCEIHYVYIWPLRPCVFCLSFINNS